ncbi:MAG TPA: SpoIID/LytB domain-containing protein, partial [Patescibacteria group bacterium]|nr:SpoIID/LytB domain-containing protein [Patescibacteria group bacterium]
GVLLSGNDIDSVSTTLGIQERVQQNDEEQLTRLSSEISQFEADKKSFQDTGNRLVALQKSLDSSAEFFKGEVAKAKKYQQDLAGKISALSARQQEILAERSGTATTTVGDVPLSDDPASSPTYNPGFSPAFAVFSFGAPHFKGMSQYGAYGRAKVGQSADDILHAYYGGGIEIKKDYSTSVNITVQGHETVDIETYVKRIYEMPNSWGDNGGLEALKAQAVAARSYALAYTNNGANSICATESCQVYKSSNKGGKWEEAVNATRGWVLIANGKPFSAWYAASSGGYQQSYTANGYSTPAFWDTTGDWSTWANGAYEGSGKGNSPWFYKAWYKSRSGDTCGRSHPWLTQDEFADILNAWVVRYHGSGDEVSKITPEGPCWSGGGYSKDELKNKANQYGGAFTSISSVRVEHGSNGYTKNVIIDTNRGSVTIAGAEFKTAFNLRAPGRISVKGNLFGVERK